MTNDQYFKALENFTVQEMPNLTGAQISGSLVMLLSRVIVSAAGGDREHVETLLEFSRHNLDIEIGRALKNYAFS